ncbi:MAG TPA: hypothetical protein VNN79_23490 [Actinomycetota bacterium]|nr:hypothetical protein [Actinomycetota bacterium]
MADVYPVYNGVNVQFIPGVPAVPHLGITKKEAEELIATGAFTYDKPPKQPAPEAPPSGGAAESTEE